MMVRARKPHDDVRQFVSSSVIKQIVVEEHRPQSSRGKYSQDAKVTELVQAVLDTVDTNRSVKAELTDVEVLNNLAMHLRHHATTKGGLRLHTQHLPDGWLRAWVERVKAVGK